MIGYKRRRLQAQDIMLLRGKQRRQVSLYKTDLAAASFGVDAVRILHALSAHVAILLANKASRVGEAAVFLLGLWAHPQSMLRRTAVEALTSASL